MDQSRLALGNGEDNVGILDDLRCKRSDGKRWRCTAMSMPDKTVCEKHYIQAKKRAANSAMRANLKKAKRRSLGESDIFLESKSDDLDVPLASVKSQERKYMEKTLMEAQNPLKKLVAKLAISVGGMTETQSFGASNVIEEDTVTAVFRHGTWTSH